MALEIGGAQPAHINVVTSEEGLAAKARQKVLDFYNRISDATTPGEVMRMTDEAEWRDLIAWLDMKGYARTKDALIARVKESFMRDPTP